MSSNAELASGQQHAQASQSLILNLHSDCLLKILRYLEVEDMAIASDVCQRFQELAGEAFKYEWKTKIIWLGNESTANRLESTAILRNFGLQLSKVHIVFGEQRNRQRNDEFFDMIIEKCSSSQLTEVVVSSEILSKENVCRLKNRFPNLKSLAFENDSDYANRLLCIEQHFPALDQLRLFGGPFENRNVELSMRLNPQIKRLSLLYRNGVENIRILLDFFDQHLPQIEELELDWIGGYADDSGYQPMFLKNLKRLKFVNFGIGVNMQYLSISNENVEELVLEEGMCDESVMDFICQYKQVKKLAILDIDYPLDYKTLLQLHNHLPNLVELEISSFCRNINHKDIAHFILCSKHLVKFVIKDQKRREVIFEDMRDLQNRLATAKWTADYRPSSNEVIFKKSNYGLHRKKKFKKIRQQ